MIWPGEGGAAPKEVTYIVLGNPHGGTTLMAGLMRLMGVYMGHQIDTCTQEDVQMRSEDLDAIRSVVENRNSAFDQWGWKCPGSIHYLDDLKPSLRNPHLIVIFRDPYATMLRSLAVDASDPLGAFEQWMTKTRKLLSVVKLYGVPTLFVSYELALKKPELMIEDLVRFTGISELSETLRTRMLSYIDPKGGYGNFPASTQLEQQHLKEPVSIDSVDCELDLVEFVRSFGVRQAGERWILDLDDPHCFVRDDDLSRFLGSRTIRFEVKVTEGEFIEPSLYLDIGSGLREEDRIRFGRLSSGVWDFLIEIPSTLGALRLDPDEKCGVIDKLVVLIA